MREFAKRQASQGNCSRFFFYWNRNQIKYGTKHYDLCVYVWGRILFLWLAMSETMALLYVRRNDDWTCLCVCSRVVRIQMHVCWAHSVWRPLQDAAVCVCVNGAAWNIRIKYDRFYSRNSLLVWILKESHFFIFDIFIQSTYFDFWYRFCWLLNDWKTHSHHADLFRKEASIWPHLTYKKSVNIDM